MGKAGKIGAIIFPRNTSRNKERNEFPFADVTSNSSGSFLYRGFQYGTVRDVSSVGQLHYSPAFLPRSNQRNSVRRGQTIRASSENESFPSPPFLHIFLLALSKRNSNASRRRRIFLPRMSLFPSVSALRQMAAMIMKIHEGK